DNIVICHRPPGNEDNPQTITVDSAALPAHLAHGDTPGPCVGSTTCVGVTGLPAPTFLCDVTSRACKQARCQPNVDPGCFCCFDGGTGVPSELALCAVGAFTGF